MLEIAAVMLGLAFGSFANVVIHRLPGRESVVSPASRCPACGHPLAAGDLVPVFSYLRLGGRCRYCRAKISGRYPLVEGMSAFLFLLVYSRWGISATALSGLILGFILICAAFTDLERGIIPDGLTLPGLLIGLLAAHFTVGPGPALLGALGFAGLLLLLSLLSHGGLGGGDIKLAAVIGAFCGWPNTLASLALVSLIGGVYALYLLATGRAGRRTKVRYGPVLSLGAFLGFNYGTELASRYLALFH
jgi:leader peptidase (prepilin peptidase)/N-methyltransferase